MPIFSSFRDFMCFFDIFTLFFFAIKQDLKKGKNSFAFSLHTNAQEIFAINIWLCTLFI